MSQIQLALIGNPNCGKTTLFNNLTGAYQRVGNWAGVTVEKKSGQFNIGELTINAVDLPGIYSLEQQSQGIDEEIARHYLDNDTPEIILNIIDACNLERSLVLTNQLLELNIAMVVVLNMQDVAMAHGVAVDTGVLEKRLGVPVVSTIASSKQGMEHLKRHIHNQSDPLHRISPQQQTKSQATKGTRDQLLWRYQQVASITAGVMSRHRLTATTEKVDRWVLNKWLGIPIFLFAMYLLFTVAINLGAVFIDFFDILFAAVFIDGSRYLLDMVKAPQLVTTFVSDGVGGGITLVATFIPVIAFLYLGLALMEDSGYVARAAFVIDRLMLKIGLPGTAFVPLIVGFGCNVPAVMATRSLQHHNERLLTIAMAPFMSCGARLTVYALFAAAFFPQQGQNIVFGLYLIGILMAVLTGLLFKKQLFSTTLSASFQEMPAYHRPLLRNIALMTWYRLRGFILRAGKAIVLVVTVLSMLNALGTDGSFGNQNTDRSVLSKLGKSITPLFEPIGVQQDNWPATVGLFTGMFAKEVVVGTLDTLYSPVSSADNTSFDFSAALIEATDSIADGFENLLDSLSDPLGLSIGDVSDRALVVEEQQVSLTTMSIMEQQFGSQLAAFTYLVFILLYAPCVAVVGAMVKEAGWPWAVLVFSWTTALAYYTASSIYLMMTITSDPLFNMTFVIVASLLMMCFVFALPKLVSSRFRNGIIPTVSLS